MPKSLKSKENTLAGNSSPVHVDLELGILARLARVYAGPARLQDRYSSFIRVDLALEYRRSSRRRRQRRKFKRLISPVNTPITATHFDIFHD